MTFIKIPLPRCAVYLTAEEISRLLSRDPELFKVALRRGKAFIRADTQRARLAKRRNE